MRSHRPDFKAFTSLTQELLEYIDWLEHTVERLDYDLNFIKNNATTRDHELY